MGILNQHYKIIRYGSGVKYSVLCFAPLNALTEDYVRVLYEPLLSLLKSEAACYILHMSLYETEDIQAETASAIEELKEELQGREILLLGWCSGGVLSLKAAEILENCGMTVKSVLMLDTFEPGYIMQVQNEKRLSLDGLSFPAYHVHSFLLQMDSQQPYFKSNQCLRDIHALRDGELADYIYMHLKHLGFSREMVSKFLYRNIELTLHVDSRSEKLLEGVSLRPCRCRVVLVKAERESGGTDDFLGWRELLGNQVLLLQSPYTHDTMMIEENVMAIVQVIEEILEG